MTNFFRFCLLLVFIPVLAGAAPDKLGSLAPYLMDRQAEIDLARSAAPASISKDCDRAGLDAARIRDGGKRQQRI